MLAISVHELKHRLEQDPKKPKLLDVREPWEYRLCHLSGAQLLPMGEIHSSLEKLDPEEEIVVVCHHGIRSRQVCYYLSRQGFTRVINLEGGMHAWALEIDTNMATY